MRVAFANHTADIAGAERSMVSVLEVLATHGHEVHVWVPGPGPLIGHLKALGAQVHRQRSHWWMSRRGGGVIGLIRLAQAGSDTVGFVRAWRRVRPDVVVVNTSVTPAPVLAGALLRIPTVTIVRESLRSNPTLRSLLPKTVIVAALARWSTQVVTISRYVSEQLEPWPSGAPAPLVRHPGVSLDPLPKVARAAGDGTMRLLLLGSIGGDKGQREAVQAAGAAIECGADLRLDMYGDGVPSELTALRGAIADSGHSERLCLHRPIDDIRPLLARADALIMASRNEGYGRVTVEALQAGVPVVGYAAGATTEILEQGGGLLVPPGVRALHGALCEVAADGELLARLTEQAVEVGRRLQQVPRSAQLAEVIEAVASTAAVRVSGPGASRRWESDGKYTQ
ncbi:MAG: glycosyltransferase family 4 protein [Ornithinimicrobium sp.]